MHYTIELPWAADKAIQQLGRSHRAGQTTAPIYRNCVTNLGGERRFAAAVSKRMESLGALTKGDRRAASGADMSAFNVDSKHGVQALARMGEALSQGVLSKPCRGADAVLDEFVDEYGSRLGLVSGGGMDAGEVRSVAYETAKRAMSVLELDEKQQGNVKIFLNRIMGLPVCLQNLLFGLFTETLKEIVHEARKSGWYEGCVEDLRARRVKMESTQRIAVDSSSGAETRYSVFVLDRGWRLEDVVEEMKVQEAEVVVEEEEGEEWERGVEESDDEKGGGSDDGNDDGDNEEGSHGRGLGPRRPFLPRSRPCPSGFYISKRPISGSHLAIYAAQKFSMKDPLGVMCVYRPNTGKTGQEFTAAELRSR